MGLLKVVVAHKVISGVVAVGVGTAGVGTVVVVQKVTSNSVAADQALIPLTSNVVPAAPFQVVLRSVANGRFVASEVATPGTGRGKLRARSEQVGPWESFTVVSLAGENPNRVAIRANGNGKFVSAEHGYGKELRARADKVGDWETFTAIRHGEGYALRADDGSYVSADPADPTLFAKGEAPGPWEEFEFLTPNRAIAYTLDSAGDADLWKRQVGALADAISDLPANGSVSVVVQRGTRTSPIVPLTRLSSTAELLQVADAVRAAEWTNLPIEPGHAFSSAATELRTSPAREHRICMTVADSQGIEHPPGGSRDDKAGVHRFDVVDLRGKEEVRKDYNRWTYGGGRVHQPVDLAETFNSCLQDPHRTLKILHWNAAGATHMFGSMAPVDRLVEKIDEYRPDLVDVNEICQAQVGHVDMRLESLGIPMNYVATDDADTNSACGRGPQWVGSVVFSTHDAAKAEGDKELCLRTQFAQSVRACTNHAPAEPKDAYPAMKDLVYGNHERYQTEPNILLGDFNIWARDGGRPSEPDRAKSYDEARAKNTDEIIFKFRELMYQDWMPGLLAGPFNEIGHPTAYEWGVDSYDFVHNVKIDYVFGTHKHFEERGYDVSEQMRRDDCTYYKDWAKYYSSDGLEGPCSDHKLLMGALTLREASLPARGPRGPCKGTKPSLSGDCLADILSLSRNDMYKHWLDQFVNPGDVLGGAKLEGVEIGHTESLPGGVHPVEIQLADLDGDRRTDLIGRGATSDDVYAWRNLRTVQGKPVFDKPKKIWTGSVGEVFLWADINGDGRDDLLFYDWQYGGGNIVTYFVKPNPFAVDYPFEDNTVVIGNEPVSLVVRYADIDGDGYDDKLWFHKEGITVHWNQHGPDNEFGSWFEGGPWFFYDIDGKNPPDVTKFAFADLDGNGADDIIRLNDDRTLDVWRNPGGRGSGNKARWAMLPPTRLNVTSSIQTDQIHIG